MEVLLLCNIFVSFVFLVSLFVFSSPQSMNFQWSKQKVLQIELLLGFELINTLFLMVLPKHSGGKTLLFTRCL